MRWPNGSNVIIDSSNFNHHGLQLNIFRALLPNDRPQKWAWKNFGLDRMTPEPISFNINEVDAKMVKIETKIIYKLTRGTGFTHGFDHFVTYTIFANGVIDVESKVVPYGELPMLPRIGVKMAIGNEYENLQWYGRGPHENYIDRQTGAALGLYKSTVTEQYFPYLDPQATGNREDVKWLLLSNSAGEGLLVVAKDRLSATALHYRENDIYHAKNTAALNPVDAVVLSLDFKQRGVGNGSCGPDVLPQYDIAPEPCSFRFSLRPFSTKTGKALEMARRTIEQ
ncbi:MAG: hypothetical protein HC896_11255 [Bacteroidales bacterium]|nr:hypothetical protein [Bacteroidales bacterium]